MYKVPVKRSDRCIVTHSRGLLKREKCRAWTWFYRLDVEMAIHLKMNASLGSILEGWGLSRLNDAVCLSSDRKRKQIVLHFPLSKLLGIMSNELSNSWNMSKVETYLSRITWDNCLCIKLILMKAKNWLTIYYVLSRSTCTPGLFCHSACFC